MQASMKATPQFPNSVAKLPHTPPQRAFGRLVGTSVSFAEHVASLPKEQIEVKHSPTRLMHGNLLLAIISGGGSAVVGPNLLQKCTGRTGANAAEALQRELGFWTA